MVASAVDAAVLFLEALAVVILVFSGLEQVPVEEQNPAVSGRITGAARRRVVAPGVPIAEVHANAAVLVPKPGRALHKLRLRLAQSMSLFIALAEFYLDARAERALVEVPERGPE